MRKGWYKLDRDKPNQVVLVLVEFQGQGEEQLEWELAELKELVDTAGGEVIGWLSQKRDKLDRALLVGKGKAQEVADLAEELEADLVIFNQPLSPAQLRNLEEIIPVQVLDRNQLILDIFALRASSTEGKLQVELAQLQYLLPRLTGRGVEMSRLAGGIGTRGPGETKLETDRRRIRTRVDQVKQDLALVAQRRTLQRKNRQQGGVPLVALVGYTNAGKTSLLTALTGAAVQGEDKLFATLDTTIRQLELPSGQQALLSDTVGFIQHLPPQLIKAFRATLEETLEADLLLHVVDATSPQVEGQVATVNQVLLDMGAGQIPTLVVLNKTDLLSTADSLGAGLNQVELMVKNLVGDQELIAVSALQETNLPRLLEVIEEKLTSGLVLLKVLLPYEQGQLVSYLRQKGAVQVVDYRNDGIWVEVLADQEIQGRLAPYAQGKQ